MTPTIYRNLPYRIELSKLSQDLHISPTTENYTEFEQLGQTALAIGRAKGIYLESAIEERGFDFVKIDGITFNSRILSVNVEGESKVYPFIVTSGLEFDKWLDSISDVLERYWAEKMLEAALESAFTTLKGHICAQFQLRNISMMNPGSLEDWPIEEQSKLFAVLGNPKKAIGVELTESYLMKPVKSLSGIFFKSEAQFENCRLCPKEGCPGRRAPYEEELHRRKYFFSR